MDKFFCCFELENGGIYIAQLGISFQLFSLFIVTLGFLLEERKFLSVLIDAFATERDSFRVLQRNEHRLFVPLVALLYGIMFLRLYSSRSLRNGAVTRNHKKVLIYVIIDAISMAIFALYMFTSVRNAVVGFFMFYLSFCTFMLYKKLQKQSIQRANLPVQCELAVVRPVINYPQLQQAHGYVQVISNQQPQMYIQAQPYQQPHTSYLIPSAPSAPATNPATLKLC